jgi:hypothetical protein
MTKPDNGHERYRGAGPVQLRQTARGRFSAAKRRCRFGRLPMMGVNIPALAGGLIVVVVAFFVIRGWGR